MNDDQLLTQQSRQLAHEIFLKGVAELQIGQLASAQHYYKEVLQHDPFHAEAIHHLGIIEAEFANFQNAKELITKSLEINPSNGVALKNRGLTKQNLDDFTGALSDFLEAKKIIQTDPELDYNCGSAYLGLHEYEKALIYFERLIKQGYVNALILNDRANALHECGRTEEALQSYDRAIAMNPSYSDARYNKGLLLQSENRIQEAIVEFCKTIEIDPSFIEAYNNLGIIYEKLFDFHKALEVLKKAVELNPEYVEAHANLGNVYASLKETDKAIQCYDKAIALKREVFQLYNNRANALSELDRLQEALNDYDKAIELNPNYVDAYSNKALTLHEMKMPEEALESYQKALLLKPNYEYLFGLRLHTKMIICDWRDCEQDLAELTERIVIEEKASTPFPLLSLTSSCEIQKKATEIYTEDKYPTNDLLGFIGRRANKEVITVGYFSGDFRSHAIAILMVGLLEAHDRSKFRLVAFSFSPLDREALRARVENAFDEFIDVTNMSDEAAARLARSKNIDIAVDLTGYTQLNRTLIFAYRAAPIQVNYLGFPGTMGADYMDYLIADPVVIPPESQRYYTEKIAYLPNCYQANDSKRMISERVFSRSELGLPENAFVFCCFNNNYKITPDVFTIWMRILQAVPNSVLWLIEDNLAAAKNLKAEAEKRGVSADRIIFAPRMQLAEHLARHRAADLFLDTLPYNAHTTASDALWAGLPVLTCLGTTFPGRVAASLLKAVGLPELITNSAQEYESMALDLASHPEKLNGLKAKLAANRLVEPLFDTERFARDIENLYTQMYKRYQNDLAPESMGVI